MTAGEIGRVAFVIVLTFIYIISVDAIGQTPTRRLTSWETPRAEGKWTPAQIVEHLVAPVRDLFATLFFVSVGMLIATRIGAREARSADLSPL